MRPGLILMAALLAAPAAAQGISVPGTTPAASAESQTDTYRRLLLGKWLLAAEYIGEDQIRHFTSITSVYRPDGTGTRTVVMEIGRVDGTGTQIKEGGKDEAILYRIEAIDAETFKITQWTPVSAAWEETWKVVDQDTMMEIKTQLVWKRQAP